MCVKLQNNGRIIIPGVKVPLRVGNYEKDVIWGVDLGHGWIANARLESVLDKVWDKWGFTNTGFIKVEEFFEKDKRFHLTNPVNVGIIHNFSNFLVVTEPATMPVKKYHHRQPCYLNLSKLMAA